MSKKLAGTLFVYNGNKFDYCYKEAIQCLLEFCDKVFIVAGGDDNTHRDCCFISSQKLAKGIRVRHISMEDWNNQLGKEKLNYFTNIAIELAQSDGYEYQLNLQADEILHEDSYKNIRAIIEGGGEGYMCKRINLWSSPYMQLNVPHNRLPCSTDIVRLAKTKYLSYGDAESINVDDVNENYINQIRIYHMGFVRNRKVMKSKIINMQQGVFAMEHYDSKLDQCEIFNPELWFSKNDLKPIDEPLPKIIQQWAKERVYE